MKNYLIIGGSGGIGTALCKTFIKHNEEKHIIATYNKHSIDSKASNFYTKKCDISKKEEIEKIIKEIQSEHGFIDRVVINAGMTKDKLFITMKEEEFTEVLNVNLLASFRILKDLLYPMLKKRDGRIVFISSIVGFTGNPAQSNYCTSKSALLGFCRSLVKEYASKGINANIVAPGFIKTPMTDKIPDKFKQRILENIPNQQFGDSMAVAELVTFLLTSKFNYINGAVIPIDGGLSMGL